MYQTRHSLPPTTFSDQSDFSGGDFQKNTAKNGGERQLRGLADVRLALRSTSPSTLRLVQIRVEIGVVVHLELTVGLMSFVTRENVV